MINPFARKPIILKDIKIPVVGKGYTMTGTVPEVVNELQATIIYLEGDKTRLRNALDAKTETVRKLDDEIASLQRKIFQLKHEVKAR